MDRDMYSKETWEVAEELQSLLGNPQEDNRKEHSEKSSSFYVRDFYHAHYEGGMFWDLDHPQGMSQVKISEVFHSLDNIGRSYGVSYGEVLAQVGYSFPFQSLKVSRLNLEFQFLDFIPLDYSKAVKDPKKVGFFRFSQGREIAGIIRVPLKSFLMGVGFRGSRVRGVSKQLWYRLVRESVPTPVEFSDWILSTPYPDNLDNNYVVMRYKEYYDGIINGKRIKEEGEL